MSLVVEADGFVKEEEIVSPPNEQQRAQFILVQRRFPLHSMAIMEVVLHTLFSLHGLLIAIWWWWRIGSGLLSPNNLLALQIELKVTAADLRLDNLVALHCPRKDAMPISDGMRNSEVLIENEGARVGWGGREYKVSKHAAWRQSASGLRYSNSVICIRLFGAARIG